MSLKRFNELIRLPTFERDIRKIAKKFRTIEDDLNVVIEIYYKGDKENEDRERITKYYL
jgi:hypothetical protein